jgi:hypothetical protein
VIVDHSCLEPVRLLRRLKNRAEIQLNCGQVASNNCDSVREDCESLRIDCGRGLNGSNRV